MTTPQTYADLQPQDVLEALDAVGLRGDGRLLQLNSYENRVFQVHLESGEVMVAKFYRPGRWSDEQILEEHGFSHELLEAEVPVVAPLALTPAQPPAQWAGTLGNSTSVAVSGVPRTLATWIDDRAPHTAPRVWRFSVSPRKAGRGPELEDEETVRWIGRFVARVHEVGARRAFQHRRTLDVDTLGRASQAWLLHNGFVTPAEASPWKEASTQALDLAAEAFNACQDCALVRLHGDAHPGNILWRPEGPHVVDLDDACNGPAIQDLWMLLPGDDEGRARQLRLLIEGYETVRDFDDRELRLIEPLRTLRILHHSAWLAQRWSDPAFPVAFPYFGTAAYWSEQTVLLREQVGKMAGG